MIRQLRKLLIVPKRCIHSAALARQFSALPNMPVNVVNKRFNMSMILLPLFGLLLDDDDDDDDDKTATSKSATQKKSIDKQFELFIRSHTSIILRQQDGRTILKQIACIEDISECDIILIDNFLHSLSWYEVRCYIRSDDHVYPIITACRNIELLKVLLKYYPDVNIRFNGNTPLLDACEKFDLERINLLLGRADASIRSQKRDKFTPLMYFCYNSSKWRNYNSQEIHDALIKFVSCWDDKILLEKTADGKTAFDFIDDANKKLLSPMIFIVLQSGWAGFRRYLDEMPDYPTLKRTVIATI